MQKKTIMQTVEKDIYIADDGTEFATSEQCESYEEYRKTSEGKVDKMRDYSLDGLIPIHRVNARFPAKDFHWYRVQNEEDWNTLQEVIHHVSTEPRCYPDLIGIECKDDITESHGSCSLANLIHITNEFFGRFGYQLTKVEKSKKHTKNIFKKN
jgi:hypothetical protein